MSLNESTFYSRINEFGEYKYNNRLDTLFVLQLTFIITLIFIGLYYLNIFGLFSKIGMYLVTGLLLIILFLIIINKAVVMPKIRSKTVWDKYNFGDKVNKPTVPYVVESGVDGGEKGTSPNSNCETRTETICSQQLEI
jgi:hypothetical protein